MSDCKEIKRCLCCDSKNLKMVFRLGDQPLANSYSNKPIDLPKYPLALNFCKSCHHLQLTHAVNPDAMFKNYLYVTGTSNTMQSFCKDFVEVALNKVPHAKKVLDIASNDGTQLSAFKDRGLQTFGIDPATNLKELAESKGHEIVDDYLSKKSIKNLSETKFDIIVAQNVFAHNTYPHKFLKLCKKALLPGGKIFIQTSQTNMIMNNEFDTIYHEHVSFFNAFSMRTLVRLAGLELNDILTADIHGGSSIYVISKSPEISSRVDEAINQFFHNKLDLEDTYSKYVMNAVHLAHELKLQIELYRSRGYKIIGYGAAAKGNTLLNFGNIKLDFIVDDNPNKWDLYTPGMNIRIMSPEELLEVDIDAKVLFVPLAWNFYDEIKNKILYLRNCEQDRFIKYFPIVTIEESSHKSI